MNWNGVSYIGKQRPRGAELLSAGPVSGAVPSLLRDAERDEGELDLAGFEQLEVFHRPFGRPHDDGQAELAGQQPRQPLAIGVVGAAGRCGGDRERRRANAARPTGRRLASREPRSGSSTIRTGVRSSCPTSSCGQRHSRGHGLGRPGLA